MNILHIVPHLGGGVGKAHSALVNADAADIRRHYMLLEAPRDRRFLDIVAAAGATLEIAPDHDRVTQAIAAADIVQIEWWNHPRLYELLARPLPAMRSLFWVHLSGLFAPFYPVGLAELAGRFVFTSPCSLEWKGIEELSTAARARVAVAGSGFGYMPSPELPSSRTRRDVSYLGTVDFVKMHAQFFEIVDALQRDDMRVDVYGSVLEGQTVTRAWQAMRNPERVVFAGQIGEPYQVLANSAVFFYPLRPDHYGTAENALIEAMSVGAVPLVMNNPAEMAIVRDGETGIIVKNAAEATERLSAIFDDRDLLERLSQAAIETTARDHRPQKTAAIFARLYTELMDQAKSAVNFGDVLGYQPRDWFLSTQTADPAQQQMLGFSQGATRSKGSLDHFLSVFPDDAELLALAVDRFRT